MCDLFHQALCDLLEHEIDDIYITCDTKYNADSDKA
jgi:hypothetical protein